MAPHSDPNTEVAITSDKPAPPPTAVSPTQDEAEPYVSEEDSDFDVDAPDATLGAEEDESASETEDAGGNVGNEEEGGRPRKRRKVSGEDGEDEDEDVIVEEAWDSGDEVTIRKAKEKMEKMRRKKEKGKTKGKSKGKSKGKTDGDSAGDDDDDFDFDEDEVGGEGGFVRTRGMRMKMQEERKPLAKVDGSTVDVDAIWAQLNAPSTNTAIQKSGTENGLNGDKDTIMTDGDQAGPVQPSKVTATTGRPGEETINIKRTYKFAGEVITEEKTVPKESAEARLYLSSIDSTKKKAAKDAAVADDESEIPKTKLQRPLRRISRFDPNPPDAIKKSWEKQAIPDAAAAAAAKGSKLNTVMKSKLDWAAYVDKEGIKDDLDVHSKAKEGYMGRMDFLGRVEERGEEERRNARLKKAGF